MSTTMSDSSDEIDLCPNVGPHEVVPSIKSNAVVRFSAVQVPVKFNRLECNTNLNLPPSNWLTTSENSCGLYNSLYHTSGFPSFRMAHMFPDCLDEVDVISDAENIKKLLKLPYSLKSPISMVVHKVANTLLIDEFDIQKYLLRKADDDWRWMRSFLLETSSRGNDRNFCLKDKSREAIQTKNLLSKFLYHSMKQSVMGKNKQKNRRPNAKQNNKQPLPMLGPVLPEPKIDENVPDPSSSHEFNRNVVWTFEDIRMLIGTDMPIFGGPNRPCISLRLRDMSKPINVLTGIDYWLDNLMCNVPEVVMCYHIDGIVQKYEIIKTEDLPFLENSQFAPQVVRNVAQNILAFLRMNATKAGHTYWLFKARNDEVVKLYDLTTLCQTETKCDSKEENPFTVPVAMLLYTVARNMKNSSTKVSPKKAGSIKALLDNCIKLLPKEKYPQIVTSSHYILSDLHIPTGIDPKSPKFDNSDDSDLQSVSEEDNIEYDSCEDDILDMSGNVSVKNICDTLKEFNMENNGKHGRSPSPLVGSVAERCQVSLQHILEGLKCLQYFDCNQEKFIKESEERAKNEEKMRIIHEEQHPNMAKPFRPIPLPYESLNASPREESPENTTSDKQANDLPNISTSSTLNNSASTSMSALVNTTTIDTNDTTFSVSTNSSMNTTVKSSVKLGEKLSKAKKKKLRKAKNKEVKEESPKKASSESSTQITTNFNSQLFGSWNVHLKLLLLEKASLSYATLAENYYVEQMFGSCLKAIYMAYRCAEVVAKYMVSIVSQKSCLLGRAGDCLLQIAKSGDMIPKYLTQFRRKVDIDLNICQEIKKDLENIEQTLIEPSECVESLMITSCKYYEAALESVNLSDDNTKARNELYRRLGNVRNELGRKYMYWAQEEFGRYMEDQNHQMKAQIIKNSNETSVDIPEFERLSKQSYECLDKGIEAFSKVQDHINWAFLLCNMGRYMRFKAHLFPSVDNEDCQEEQKNLYYKAFNYYEKAKTVLSSREANHELWDLVNWELSTAVFMLTKQMQDFNTDLSPDVEKEVLSLLRKSLELCEYKYDGPRQILYTYRAGLVHKRLASFYYNKLRLTYMETMTISNATLQLCKTHYEQSANLLEELRESCDLLIVQLERVSLQEFLAEVTPRAPLKVKLLESALEMLFICHTSLDYNQRFTQDGTDSDNFFHYLKFFESRLQYVLKTIIKILMTMTDSRCTVEHYKQMYMETLKGVAPTTNEGGAFATYMMELMTKLTECQKRQSCLRP